MTIDLGDNVEVMAGYAEASIDAIVTDPPYGIEFMGKAWDSLGRGRPRRRSALDEADAVGLAGRFHGKLPERYIAPVEMQRWHEAWARAALRVARPGAYLLAFGGTRTYHRLAAGIEDAGWIIRDCLVWAYAQGFPKSRANLKPSWEPIVLARRPGPLRELNIDAARIPTDDGYEAAWDRPVTVNAGNLVMGSLSGTEERRTVDLSASKPSGGRWPANVVLTDPIFDGGIPGVEGGGNAGGGYGVRGSGPTDGRSSYALGGEGEVVGYGDEGTWSRFFLVPKASRSDREPNAYGAYVTELEPAVRIAYDGAQRGDPELGLNARLRTRTPRLNGHPTVKPVELMRHLVRLVTPVGGTLLDPFLGSGTTAIAADLEGLNWRGIERDPQYVRMAEARIAGVQRGLPW